ncbi:MAG: small acid-soluble spore protein [Bacteroidota bacterium]
MSHKKDPDRLRGQRALDELRWESAKELGLDQPTSPAVDGLQATGTIKDRIRLAEEEIAAESARKAELNYADGPAPRADTGRKRKGLGKE